MFIVTPKQYNDIMEMVEKSKDPNIVNPYVTTYDYYLKPDRRGVVEDGIINVKGSITVVSAFINDIKAIMEEADKRGITKNKKQWLNFFIDMQSSMKQEQS